MALMIARQGTRPKGPVLSLHLRLFRPITESYVPYELRKYSKFFELFGTFLGHPMSIESSEGFRPLEGWNISLTIWHCRVQVYKENQFLIFCSQKIKNFLTRTLSETSHELKTEEKVTLTMLSSKPCRFSSRFIVSLTKRCIATY